MAQAIRRPGKIEAGQNRFRFRKIARDDECLQGVDACAAYFRGGKIDPADVDAACKKAMRVTRTADLDLKPSGLEESESQIEAILAVLGNDPQERQRSFASVAAPAMHERDRT